MEKIRTEKYDVTAPFWKSKRQEVIGVWDRGKKLSETRKENMAKEAKIQKGATIVEEELTEAAWYEEGKNVSFNATAYLAQFGIVVG